MAHPTDCPLINALKKDIRSIHINFRFAEFADWRGSHNAAKFIRHRLRTITNAENRDAKIKNLFWTARGIFLINTVWSAGKNNALRIHLPDFLKT